MLGIFACAKELVAGYHEYHVVIAVLHVNDLFTQFCTPLGRLGGLRGTQPLACDEELRAHVLRNNVNTGFSYDTSKDRLAVFRAARDISAPLHLSLLHIS